MALPVMQAPPSFLLPVFSQEAEHKVRPRRDLVKMSVSDTATSGHLSWRFGMDWQMIFLLTLLSFTQSGGMCVSGGVWAQNFPSFSLLLSFDLWLQLYGVQPILPTLSPRPKSFFLQVLPSTSHRRGTYSISFPRPVPSRCIGLREGFCAPNIQWQFIEEAAQGSGGLGVSERSAPSPPHQGSGQKVHGARGGPVQRVGSSLSLSLVSLQDVRNQALYEGVCVKMYPQYFFF